MNSRPSTTNRLILYQVLVRQFANQTSPNIPGANWSVNGSGTLDDISHQILKSIQNLGCNAVWLTGIVRHASRSDKPETMADAAHPSLVKGMAGSPYAIQDFFALHPDILRRPDQPVTELSDCLQRIHILGMKAFMDFVPNHCARKYHSPTAKTLGLRDLGEGDDASLEFHPHNHYYYLPGQELHLPPEIDNTITNPYHEFPARATGNDCFRPDPGMHDWYETIKLNYGLDYRNGQTHFHPAPPVWRYMREVLLFWAEKGMDGFRCDMAEMVPLPFWSWVIAEVKTRFPQVRFIAEVYNPDMYRAFIAAGFDYLYDKAGMYDCLRAIMEGHGDCRQLSSVWQQQEGIQPKMLRFLENHDEQRIASRFFAGNAEKGIPAFAAAAFSGQAALMVYAGQEFGEKAEASEGFSGDDGRSSIFDFGCAPTIQDWLKSNISVGQNLYSPTQELRLEYRKILQLLKEESALSGPHFYDLQYANPESEQYDARSIWSFLRYDEQQKLLIICSFSEENREICLNIPSHALEILKFSLPGKIRIESKHQENWFTDIDTLPKSEHISISASATLPVPAMSFALFQIKQIN
jgi:glycosidase